MLFRLVLPALSIAGLCTAQGNLASILQSDPDLSILLDLVILANLTDTLSAGSNITIIAPNNDAFTSLTQLDIPESIAIRERDPVTVGALLRNHVFQGYYPSSEIGEIPIFVQSLVMPDEQNAVQPFTAITGGQYNGLVKNGNNVDILSSEFTVSRVVQADIRVSDDIIVHKVDQALSFGIPFLLFLSRYGYSGLGAAYQASNLSLFAGMEINSASESPFTDITVFIPVDEALRSIGSVLAIADQDTLQEVIQYHVIDDIIFSSSITNATAVSQQSQDLIFSVTEDGSIFVNNAKVIIPNVLLYEGVAHIVDSVLNPLVPFNRSQLKPDAPAAERVQFSNATSTGRLPFTSVSFASESTFAFTVAPVFTTAPAVSVSATVTATSIASSSTSSIGQYTGMANAYRAPDAVVAGAALLAAIGVGNLA